MLGQMIATVSELRDMYAQRGQQRYDEAVTQEQHALQCAALARAAGADDELVAAALLHDLGHLLAPPRDPTVPRPSRETPDTHHGGYGAAVLRGLAPERVVWLVEHHVVAKRYLCTVEPTYGEGLSPASVRSLQAQGGVIDAARCRELQAHPWFSDAVWLRRWDDRAKDPKARVPEFAAYTALLETLLRRIARSQGGER
jgi:phosphonate degradation associated HDIG domain protein